MKPNALAVIPARGGSKGLLKKNIRPLCGKPLVAYTIESALAAQYITRVVVSTEDVEIAEISKKYGAEVIERPQELARDDSPVIDAILYTLKCCERQGSYFDIVLQLEATSPLRKEGDLDSAIRLFIENMESADSLVSLGEIHVEHPYIAKNVEQGYVKPLIKTGKSFFQRQQLPKTYFPYGVIYLSKVDTLRIRKTFYQDRTIPYFIERWQNYEIDDVYDFICVEAILKHRLGSCND